jgi:hypothetical protein
MDARRFLPRHGCRVGKFPLAECTRSVAKGTRTGACFFGLRFFARAKKRFTAAEWLIKVTRSEGAKAFAVDVAVAFNNKQSKSMKSSGASSALQVRDRCHLHERHWIFDPRPSDMARWRSAPREPVDVSFPSD